MKPTLIIEWVVSAAMLGAIALLAFTQSTAVRNEELAARSNEILHAAELLVSLIGDAGMGERGELLAGERGPALSRLRGLLAGNPETVSRLDRIAETAGARAADSLVREIAALQIVERRRLADRLHAAAEVRRRNEAAVLVLAVVGWLLFRWSWRRSGRQERINSAITRQLRRYVQELERARSIQTETAADLMRLNEELAAAKNRVEHAMEARAQVMARISHDIRTPLSGIAGMSQLLMEGETNPANREYVLAIHSCANSLTLLLNDVLDLSKAESGKVVLTAAPFDLHALCLEIANLFRAAIDGKPVRLEFSYGADTPRRVVGDEQRLRQVIANLVGNAVKFTSAGSVGLSVSSAMTSNGGRRFRIKVTDTGIGIPAGRMHGIFDPYEQGDPGVAARFGGTGLGLSICKHLAELMKGSIEVASVEGQGSVFTLTAPMVPAMAESGPPALDGSAGGETGPAGAGVRVLVADDNRVNQTVCRRVLEKMGASVDLAANGIEAVEACTRCEYDLVLMDCNMPDMDGYDATRLLRQSPSGRGLKIVALTADGTAEGRRRCFEVGMDDWLVKPLRVESLKALLEACGSTRPSGGATTAAASPSRSPDTTRSTRATE